jgi:hypothetical protein
MEIEVISRSENIKAVLTGAAKFYATTLKLDKSKYKVTIHSKSGLVKENECNGMCAKTGPHNIQIHIYSKLNPMKMVQTLAHEMVHAKQFAKGQYRNSRMKYGKGVNHFWLGQKVKSDYWSCPWEVEAWAKQDVLVRLLLNEIEKGNKRKKKN